MLYETLEQVKYTKADPQEVARLITDIAETKKTKARYVIGKDSIYPILKKLIPAFIFERLICYLSGYRSVKITEKVK